MPPDGYESVTLPDEVLDRLDEYRADPVGGTLSRPEAVHALLDEVETAKDDPLDREGVTVERLSQGALDDVRAAAESGALGAIEQLR